MGGLRLIFGLVGLAIAIVINFLPLILIGFIGYSIMKAIRRNSRIQGSLNTRSKEHKRFVELLIHIMMHIAKADGRVSESETQVIRQFFVQNLRFDATKI